MTEITRQLQQNVSCKTCCPKRSRSFFWTTASHDAVEVPSRLNGTQTHVVCLAVIAARFKTAKCQWALRTADEQKKLGKRLDFKYVPCVQAACVQCRDGRRTGTLSRAGWGGQGQGALGVATEIWGGSPPQHPSSPGHAALASLALVSRSPCICHRCHCKHTWYILP